MFACSKAPNLAVDSDWDGQEGELTRLRHALGPACESAAWADGGRWGRWWWWWWWYSERRGVQSSRARTAMDRSIVTLQSSTLEHSGVESALGPSGPKRSFCLK